MTPKSRLVAAGGVLLAAIEGRWRNQGLLRQKSARFIGLKDL